jgi:hypothetical protein
MTVPHTERLAVKRDFHLTIPTRVGSYILTALTITSLPAHGQTGNRACSTMAQRCANALTVFDPT